MGSLFILLAIPATSCGDSGRMLVQQTGIRWEWADLVVSWNRGEKVDAKTHMQQQQVRGVRGTRECIHFLKYYPLNKDTKGNERGATVDLLPTGFENLSKDCINAGNLTIFSCLALNNLRI
jgi:hypothetical protein